MFHTVVKVYRIFTLGFEKTKKCATLLREKISTAVVQPFLKPGKQFFLVFMHFVANYDSFHSLIHRKQ